MADFFLDTCVFFAYAYPHEDWNMECCQFFEKDYTRFTGKRVKSEINRRLHKRRQLYIDLAAHFDRDRSPDEFIASTEMNPNDRQHFESQLSILRGKPKADVLTYLREKDRVTRRGISEAFRRVQRPLIGMSYDPVCENIIQTLVENRSDAQIFVDALVWSEKRSNSVFVTLDWTDFIANRRRIIRALCRYKMIDSPESFSLRINHVAEIA